MDDTKSIDRIRYFPISDLGNIEQRCRDLVPEIDSFGKEWLIIGFSTDTNVIPIKLE